MKKTIIFCGALLTITTAHADDNTSVNEKISDVSLPTVTLPTITVTTTKHEQHTAPASVTVIKSEQLQQGNINSIADIIGSTVGVSVKSSVRDEFKIRGMNGNHTLILVDGQRVSSRNALWRGSNFDHMPVAKSSIERIEVIRGPLSTLYGSDAIGGVINIITKLPSNEITAHVEAGMSVADSLEGGDDRHISADVSIPLTDTLGVSIVASAKDFSEWNDGTENTKSILEGKDVNDVGVSVDWEVAEGQYLGFNADWQKDHRDKNIFRFMGPQKAPAYLEQSVERTRLGITHEGNWSWGDSMVSINNEKSNIDDFNTIYPIMKEPVHQSPTEKNIHMQGRANLDISANHILTVGTDYLKTEVEDKVRLKTNGKGTTDNVAVFAQDEFSVTDKLNVTVGGRYDEHDVFGGNFSPKAFVVYKLNDNIVIKGGVGGAFKAPNIHQLNENYTIVSCGGKCMLSGNKDLQPETSKTAELGTVFTTNSGYVGANIFNTKADNLIEPTISRTANSIQRNWNNVSEVDILGLELVGSFDVNDTLGVSGNYTYLKAEDDKGNTLPDRNEHEFATKVDYQIHPMINTYASTDFSSGQMIQERGKKGLTEFPSINRFNIGSSVTYENFGIDFGINNITDVKLHEETPDVFSGAGREYFVNVNYAY